MGRLKALKRAAAPLSDARLTVELEEIDERLKASHGNADLADLNALLALERGVALLQTARYLDSIVQVGRRNAAARERGKRSAKLPDEMQLRRQIELGRQAGRGSEQEVKKELADRYGVSLAAVNKRLRKPNGSPEETE